MWQASAQPPARKRPASSKMLLAKLIGQFWMNTSRLRPFLKRVYAIISAMSMTWRGPPSPPTSIHPFELG
jgi:hypothetical protein